MAGLAEDHGVEQRAHHRLLARGRVDCLRARRPRARAARAVGRRPACRCWASTSWSARAPSSAGARSRATSSPWAPSCCWAVYTVGIADAAGPLLAPHRDRASRCSSARRCTRRPQPRSWPASSGRACPRGRGSSMVLSAVLALNVAYLIWHTSVQRIGNVRTSAYSNFIPLVAMAWRRRWDRRSNRRCRRS
ncbi:MAG: hypothetical protein MZU84_04090 [Sphingobacterium sp.]|nr:hypothetical protein [Sphingobacterium sp.]